MIASTRQPHKIDIGIITFNRPSGLRQLLEGLNTLEFKKTPQPDLRIVVVDNDPRGSAQEIYQAFAENSRWPLCYVIEPNRGIPQARNRAIREARSNMDFIAFIDDDEEPTPQWLDEILAVQKSKQAAIVYGPVIPRFIEEPPEWVIRGGWFKRKDIPDGQQINHAATGNVLISCRVFSALGQGNWFNEKMALTGGSDTHFFLRAQQAGFQIYWTANAIVHERQPASRITYRWILMRAFRTAYTELYIDTITQPILFARSKRALFGLGRLLAGGFLLFPYSLLAIFKGRHFFIKPVRIMFRGAGMLASALNIKYEEYQHVSKM